MSLAFFYRFVDSRPTSTVYFAFSYPWSYTECQDKLAELDLKFQSCALLSSRRYNEYSTFLYFYRIIES